MTGRLSLHLAAQDGEAFSAWGGGSVSFLESSSAGSKYRTSVSCRVSSTCLVKFRVLGVVPSLCLYDTDTGGMMTGIFTFSSSFFESAPDFADSS
jgi:hypothetical protein